MQFQKICFALAFVALVGCADSVPTPLNLPATTPTRAESAPSTLSGTLTTVANLLAPTRTLTAAATQSASAQKPEIISFTVSPTRTNALGQNISLTWEAKGEKAEVCGLVETGLTNCQPLSLSGKTTFAATNASTSYAGLVLRVTTKDNSTMQSVPVVLCTDSTSWFFSPPPSRCAQPPNLSRGAAQNLEHGAMVWIAKPDMFLALYADTKQTFEMASAPYNFKPSASPNNRVGGAPNGLVEPVSGFGQLWRGEMVGVSNARQNLGWATAPEFEFDAAYQCVISSGRLWSCYLRDPRGQILWLAPDSTAGVNLIWSVVPGK